VDFPGERYVPSEPGQIKYEHLHRYALSLECVAGKAVLDVASGEGYGAALLATVARSVIGVDFDAESIAHARSCYNSPQLQFLVGSCDSIPLSTGSFDVITSFETIEHHDKHEEMLGELKRLLKPDGILIISSPNRLVYSDQPGYRNPFHIKELYYDEFLELLQRHFRHLRVYGQRLATGSFVFPLAPDHANVLSPLTGSVEHVERQVCSMPEPVYFLAICSDDAGIENRPLSSVYLDSSDDLLKAREAETMRVFQDLQEQVREARSSAARRIRDLTVRSEADLAAREKDILRQHQEIVKTRGNWSIELAKQFELLTAARAEMAILDEMLLQAEKRLAKQHELIRWIYSTKSWRIGARIHRFEGVTHQLLHSTKIFHGQLESPQQDAIIAGDVRIDGWVRSTAGPIVQVEAFLGDFYLGRVHYGTDRPDVGEAGCGYLERFSVRGLVNGEGPVELRVRVVDQKGNKQLITRRLRFPPALSPVFRGALDFPEERAVCAEHIDINGWAYSSAGGVVLVEVFVDAVRVGTLQYGVERSDVKAAFSSEVPLSVGFEGRIPIRDMPDGEKILKIRIFDERGNSQIYTRPITIVQPPSPLFVGYVEIPADGDVCSDSVQIAGWVFSNAGPICSVEAFLDNISIGGVHYGRDRYDVLAARPVEAPLECGFDQRISLLGHIEVEGRRALTIRVRDESGNEEIYSKSIVVELSNLSPFSSGVPRREEESGTHAFGAFLAAFQSRMGRDPSVLDWNSGLDLQTSYPQLAICSPPSVESNENELPYLPDSIDVVVTPASTLNRLQEARRVATVAVVRVTLDQIEVDWKDAGVPPASASAVTSMPIRDDVDSSAENFVSQLNRTFEEAVPGRRVLVCSPRMPEFDREGGSRRVFHFLEFFRRAGWQPHFVAENSIGGERYARSLQQMGLPVFALRHRFNDDDADANFDRLMRAGRFDLVVFVFWYCAEAYMPIVRTVSPDTTIVVDTVDIQFLRESRRTFCDDRLAGTPPKLNGSYANEMKRELNTYAAADAVLTVSDKEAELVNDFLGKTVSYSIPLAEDPDTAPVPFSQRRGMLFLGNFRHPPNVHAVQYLCREILPRLQPSLLERHPVYIVGTDINEEIIRSCSSHEHVRIVGWVPSVMPYLRHVRLSIVPLRYGAGTKTKLMHSLMVGTPSISTSIGIEGLNLQHRVHVLVAEDAASFAASIRGLIDDEKQWTQIAQHGRDFIIRTHGRDAVYSRFEKVFDVIQGGAFRNRSFQK
jgi:2-polyprenyl-3-methyl-5-hydroxy-6-metoxy-1,4-benzoquinol methylase/glycosyltransferase involved in cell wall biosynthesis